MQTMNLSGPCSCSRAQHSSGGLTHPLHHVLVSYDMQGARSEALFGVLVAKEGRRDHTPKEDAKLGRPKLLHCQPGTLHKVWCLVCGSCTWVCTCEGMANITVHAHRE